MNGKEAPILGSQDRSQLWADEANSDWNTALILMDAGRYNACVFYCQQAAEKAMKSLLLQLHQSPWGHSTWSLYLDASQATGNHDSAVEEATKGLDLQYAPTRYPDALPSNSPSRFYDKAKATEAMGWAKKVVEYVERCR